VISSRLKSVISLEAFACLKICDLQVVTDKSC
jgi:hypothetical protein